MANKNGLSNFEIVEALEESLVAIQEEIEKIKMVTKGTEHEYIAKAGVCSHIEMAMNHNHEWLGRNDVTLEGLMDMFRADEDAETGVEMVCENCNETKTCRRDEVRHVWLCEDCGKE